jgi:hypothetical protein
MKLTLEDFPMDSFDFMKSELARHAKCKITKSGTKVMIFCDADVVKCMEVIAIANMFIPAK